MSAHLLRQLIREQIEGLLLEGDDLQIGSIDDLDVRRVATNAIASGNLPDPRFIGETVQFIEAFNDRKKFQNWSKAYENQLGDVKVIRGTSQVRYSDADWIMIPALFGKGGDFGGVLRSKIPDNSEGTVLNALVITKNKRDSGRPEHMYSPELVEKAIKEKYIDEKATEFTLPYVLVGTTKVARAFVYKLASGAKSVEEAVEKAKSWYASEKGRQEAEQKRAEKEARAAARGASRAPSVAPPPAPSKPADPWEILKQMRAKK